MPEDSAAPKPFTALSLAIPYETAAGEAVFVRIEVWRLGAKL